MITRTIAIIPALIVSFLSTTMLDDMDTYLNILQSVQLPFALIPLVKFSCDQKVMGQFALTKCETYFASIFGVFLFILNFFVIF